jgi:L-xylulokinase
MTDKYLLGIDNGGTVAKAALFSADGKEIAVASSKTNPLSPSPGWSEFDMDGLWSAAAHSVRQVIGESGVDPRQIACLACSGHGNGIYLVDEQGNAVRNAIFSADTRARDYVARWISDGVDRVVRPKTMQSLWPGQPNALLAWLQDHEPDSLARTRRVLMCKDFIRLRLTGEAWAELTDMSGTSLINVGTAQYDPTILEAFGIREVQEKLPPLRLSADICGEVTAAAAAQTGLVAGTPVAGGLFDIDACGVSSALLDESELGMILGTWSINQYVSPSPVVSDSIFMTSRYCVPGYYLMTEASATSASNLEWFLDQFFRHDETGGRRRPKDLYREINRLVEETEPAEAAIVFLPFLYGSNAHEDASGTLVGLTSRCDRGHVLRAVYEGVVFAHRTHLERLLRFRDRPERIRASGGAARSDVWMQILADAFQAPVEVPEGSELGALGDAICAAVAVGLYDSYPSACEAMVRISRSFAPNPQLADVYETKYRRYQRLLEAMPPVWEQP